MPSKSFEDSFDDPDVLTTAFLDILWQDSNGKTALMLAAEENRVVNVKGILTMAINGSKLPQMLNLRNKSGQTALDIAMKMENEEVVKLIESYENRYYRRMSRQSSKHCLFRRSVLSLSEEASETDVKLEMEPSNSGYQSFDRDRLSRGKIVNNVRRIPSKKEMTFRMRRSRSSHSRRFNLESQRTISNDSLPTPPTTAQPIDGGGLLIGLGERLKNMMSNKKEPTSTANLSEKEREELITRLSFPAKYSNGQMNQSEDSGDECPTSSSAYLRGPPLADDTLPSFVKRNELTEKEDLNAFRSSPWSDESSSVKLPPLANLRKRAGSEGRGRQTRFMVKEQK